MKRFGLILLIMSLLASCKDETTYQMQILIKNETSSLLTIKLFPRNYISGDLYDFSGIGGGYRETEFQLGIDSEMELYISGDLNKKPNDLTAEIFDSIRVIPSNENKTEIVFTPDTVIGYSENLYDNRSLWIYKLRNFDLPTNFQRNPVESHDYIFTISDDKN
jgi:hypothetical protein